jgi:hypothetical protein
MGSQVNIGGVWKDITGVFVNIGGTWKTAQSMKCNIGGVWKDGWSPALSYGPDVTGSQTYSASQTRSGGEAANAFDDDTDTGWLTLNTVAGAWVRVQLSAGKTARKLRLYNPGNTAGIKNFTFQGSNNGSSWTTIHTAQAIQDAGWQSFTFENSTSYTYYQVVATDNWGGSAVGIREIEIMELAS